jgi:hypothetical protein
LRQNSGSHENQSRHAGASPLLRLPVDRKTWYGIAIPFIVLRSRVPCQTKLEFAWTI